MNVYSSDPNHREKNISTLYNFMKNHKLAVISTVTANFLPEASVIGFAVKKNLDIIFSSFTNSRKYLNIQKKPRVALVIGWENGKTVQYEGTANELSQAEAEKQLETSLANVPSIAKYLQLENQVLYKITPQWIRFSNLSIEPWERFEVSF